MLSCRGLCAGYGSVQVLHDLAIEVEEGEIVALLGANGAGKTTLLRTLSGLHRPSAGAIRFDGTALDGVAAEARVRRGLAHVPEGRRVFPGLTVRENLAVATSAWRRGRARIDGDLDRVFALFPRLRERAAQLAWSLSGGEQQMLAIGRALMSRPRMLLLDEPSLGLAPLLAEEVYARIRDINRGSLTVLVVEQNTVLALDVARRAYVLENGRIVLAGAAAELSRDPRVRDAYLGA
ncbi:MAG: ABC transporter ATP-binding protein [Acidisphaera sp.]|nr:ABC transporter ATP-binding protein [Acidisphaera sp.]